MKKKCFNCPAEMTIHLIGGKWRAILLYNLRKGPKRFGELKRLSPGIRQATLAKELKNLEDNGIIKRSLIGKDRLDGVEYSMTKLGESLKPVLYTMIRWGIAHQKDFALGDFRMAVFQK